VENNLVDGLKTRDEIRSYLTELVGKNKEEIGFNSIGFEKYLGIIRPSHSLKNLKSKKVAVLVAKGYILDGKHYPGNIGGDSFSELIRQARDDEKIKAVVLRIDSSGGSAFASEVIRRELELLQDTGKPVVVSMGSMAASGGYWIAANADEIWASPTTVTGSIGVMSAFPTFEETLNHLGVNNDGVGTTKMSDAFDRSRPINPLFADSLKQATQFTYKRFVGLVAEGRSMAVEAVEEVAQGRVWSGKTALQLGLVDHLGGVKDAIKSAAKKAGLDEYEVVYVERALNVKELLLRKLDIRIKAVLEAFCAQSSYPIDGLVNILSRAVEEILLMNDPRDIYSQCFTCDVQ
jgi:protease-4